jgi:DNA polymerase (family 10)
MNYSNKEQLVEIFNKLAAIEMKKGRYFPSRAFTNAAYNISKSISYECKDSRVVITDGAFETVLGQSSSDIFIEVISTGISSRLNSEIHYLVDNSDLTEVSGIGESKSQILIQAGYYDAESIRKLNLQIGDTIPNTNITYSRNIDTGLKFYFATGNKKIRRDEATKILLDFKSYMISNNLSQYEIYPVGSYRRQKSFVGDIDIILTSDSIDSNILEIVSKWFDALFVSGTTKVAGVKNNAQVDIRLIDRQYLGAHILHGTGSQEFNIKLRALAKSKGLRLNEYGIINSVGKLITFNTEKEIFNYLGVEFVNPKYR